MFFLLKNKTNTNKKNQLCNLIPYDLWFCKFFHQMNNDNDHHHLYSLWILIFCLLRCTCFFLSIFLIIIIDYSEFFFKSLLLCVSNYHVICVIWSWDSCFLFCFPFWFYEIRTKMAKRYYFQQLSIVYFDTLLYCVSIIY